MSLRPTRRVHRDVEAINLNITPVMNLFVVLIPFLLLSAVFMQMSVIDTLLPKLASSNTLDKPDDKLVVTLKIGDTGAFQVGRLGTGGGKYWSGAGSLTAKIAPLKGGEPNFAALNRHMWRIKTTYPKVVSVIIFPGENVIYDVMIKSMDATREFFDEGSKVTMFPDAVIGHEAEKG